MLILFHLGFTSPFRVTYNFDGQKNKYWKFSSMVTGKLPKALKTRGLFISRQYCAIEKRVALAHVCTHALKKKRERKDKDNAQ